MSNESPKGAQIFDGYSAGASPGGPAPNNDVSAYNDLDTATFETRDLHVSGSSRLEEVSAETFRSSGSLRVRGNARTRSFRSSGRTNVMRDVVTLQYKSSGSAHVHGQLTAGAMTSSGSMKIDGGLLGRDSIEASGLLKVAWIRSMGRVAIAGRIETGGIVCRDILVSGGGKVCDITAETVDIDSGSSSRIARILPFNIEFGRRRPFKADSIVAKGTVSIDLCDIGKVKGRVIRIGKYCHIGRVEYTESCDIAKGAIVDNPPIKVPASPGAVR